MYFHPFPGIENMRLSKGKISFLETANAKI